MIPQLFSIGPIPINTFGLMIALSLLASMYLLTESFRAYGLPADKAEQFVFVGGFSGLLGARLWYIAENWSAVRGDLIAALTSSAGFTFYGGFICAFVVIFFMCQHYKFSFASFLDAAGPTMTLGYAIGRVGCQLSGDGDYGSITHSILGMSYLTGIVPTPPGFLAYPTPLYESAICMLILPLLLSTEKNRNFGKPLRWFGLYLLLIAAERFLVEFLRINPHVLGVLSEAQVISILFMIIGFWLLAIRRQKIERVA